MESSLRKNPTSNGWLVTETGEKSSDEQISTKTRLIKAAMEIVEFSILIGKDAVSCILFLMAIKVVESANHWIFGHEGLVLFAETHLITINAATLIGVGHLCNMMLFIAMSIKDFYKVFFK